VPDVIDVATLRAVLVADTRQFQQEIEKASGLGQKFGTSLQTIGKVALGAGLAGITTAVAGLGAVIHKTVPMAVDFQSAVVDLGIAGKSSGLSLQELHDAALQVGGDTTLLGVSASGAAESMTGLYKAGLTTADIFGDLNGYLTGTTELGGALRGAIDLAAASELDMVQASDLAATTMATFGLSADDVIVGLDNFVKAADASVADVSGLADALLNVGPTAAAFGFTLEDTNNALAILSTRGIQGAEAGTSLKSMFTNIMRPTDQVKGALSELGIALYDDAGVMKSLPTIVGDFERALKGMSQEQRNTYIQTLAGTYGMKAMQTLLAEGVEGWNAMAAATEAATGINDQAAAKAQTLAGQWEAFQGNLETFGIQLGEVFLPVARNLLAWASDLANQYGPMLIAFFEQVTPVAQGFMWTLMDLFEGKIGTDTPWEDYFPPGLADTMYTITEALTQLWQTVQPFIEQVRAWLEENVKLQDVMIALAAAIAAVVIPAIVSIVATMTPIIATFAVVMGAVVLLRQAWESNFLGIRDIVEQVVTWVREFWAENGDAILAKALEIWTQVRDFITTAAVAIQAGIEVFLSTVREWWAAHGEQVIAIVTALWDGILAVAQFVMENLKTISAAFQAAFRGDWYGFGQTLRQGWDRAWAQIKEIAQKAVDWFKSVDWGKVGKAILSGIAKGIREGAQVIADAAKAAAKAALDAAKGFLGIHSPSEVFAQVGAQMMAGMAQGVTLNARLPAMATATVASSTVQATGMAERLSRIENNTTNIDRSANVTVHANYADRQSESDVARDVQTVLELLGWQ